MEEKPSYTQSDFAHSPFVAFYEVTRACDLACKHCRACAQPNRHPHELTNEQSKALLDQFASFPKRPVLVFTGGDPMKRDDIFDLVRHAGARGLTTAMTPSATSLMTCYAVDKLMEAGISRLALSIDAADDVTHDAFRGVPGSFDKTLQILNFAKAIGLPTQVNTTITIHNADQVDQMAEMFADMGISLWSVFFLIPVGRGLAEQRISPEQYEIVFEKLWQHSQKQPYAIKTTEAHHYRRFVLQKMGVQSAAQAGPIGSGIGTKAIPGRIQRAPIGVNDGKGVMFVSHTGTVYPSGFMPIRCGKFPDESIVDVYQNSPIFQDLRDPDKLRGKCGECEFRAICGGSRARAYSVFRHHLAPEPDCVYIPQAKRVAVAC